MKPLFVLTGAFFLSILVSYLLTAKTNVILSGKIALASMLIFTALGHFMYTKGMSKMLPECVPSRTAVIYFTALLEVAAAIMIFVPSSERITGLLLILFFIALLPANIYAAVKKLNYETGGLDGPGTIYLWFRVPFQILLMIWTYVFVVKR